MNVRKKQDFTQYYDAQNAFVHLESLKHCELVVRPAVEAGHLRFIGVKIISLHDKYSLLIYDLITL